MLITMEITKWYYLHGQIRECQCVHCILVGNGCVFPVETILRIISSVTITINKHN